MYRRRRARPRLNTQAVLLRSPAPQSPSRFVYFSRSYASQEISDLRARARSASAARRTPNLVANLDAVCLKHTTGVPMGTFRVPIGVNHVTYA